MASNEKNDMDSVGDMGDDASTNGDLLDEEDTFKDPQNGVTAHNVGGDTAAEEIESRNNALDVVVDSEETESFSIEVKANSSKNLQQRYADAKQMSRQGQDIYTDADFMEHLLDVYENHMRVKAALGTEDPQTVSQRALEWLLSQLSPCLCGNVREVSKFWLDDVVPIVKLRCENSHICVWHGALGEMTGFDPETSGKELKEMPTLLQTSSDVKDLAPQPIVIQPLTPSEIPKRGKVRARGKGRGRGRGRGANQATTHLAQQQMMNAMMMNPMMMMMGGLANMQNLVNLNQQAMQVMDSAETTPSEPSEPSPPPQNDSPQEEEKPQPVMLIQHRKSDKSATPKIQPKPDPVPKEKTLAQQGQREFTRAGRGQNKKQDDDSWSEGASEEETSNDDTERLSGARKRKAGPVTRQVKRAVSYNELSDVDSDSASPAVARVPSQADISVKMEVEEIPEVKEQDECVSDEESKADECDDDGDDDDNDQKPNINLGEALIKIVKMGDRWQRWGKAESDMPDFMRTLNVNQMAVQGTHMYETVYYNESGQLEPMFQELAPVRDFQCRLCQKTFTNKGAKGRHETVHAEKLYRCRWCGILRNKSISLLLHLRDDHKPDHVAPPEVYECAQCHENFLELGEIHSHMRERHKVSPSSLGEDLAVMHCYFPKCGRSFKDRSTLKFHIKRAHRENGSPICGICGKTFPSQRDRTRHLMAVHNEDYT